MLLFLAVLLYLSGTEESEDGGHLDEMPTIEIHLDLCLPAIGEQFDPGHKTAVIRGEEQDHFRNLVRIA
jgi:hypothetical protein